jgi:F420H(2)-dependent biliverdin reductase
VGVALGPEGLAFVAERRIATLVLVRPDGRPHVTPVGATWDAEESLLRVITWSGSTKSRLLEATGPLAAAVSEHDGGRWLTFEGSATVTADAARCAEAVARYARRYRPPKDRGADRRAIEIQVTRILGHRAFVAD